MKGLPEFRVSADEAGLGAGLRPGPAAAAQRPSPSRPRLWGCAFAFHAPARSRL